MEKNKDTSAKLGSMPVHKLVLSMSAPAIVSMLVQSLYNVVDSIFVSGYNEAAFTAVSLAYPIQIIIIAIAAGTGVGINSMVSRRLGARDAAGASNAAEHGIFLLIICSVLLIFVGRFASPYFFGVFTDDPVLVAYGTTYISIILMFSFGRMLAQAFMSMLQGSGNMVIPMIGHLMGAVTNIILDPILIFGTVFGIRFCDPMGVEGAAIATVIGQTVTMVFLVIMFFSREHVIKLNLRAFKPNKEIIAGILAVSVPAMITQALTSVTIAGINLILATVSIAAVTVMGAYFKIQSLVFMPVIGLSIGVMPIAGYNFGAGNRERFIKAARVGLGYAITLATAGMVVFLVAPEMLLNIFSLSPGVTALGIKALRVLGMAFPVIAITIILSGMMQAIGRAGISMIANLMRGVFILLPLAYVLLKLFSLDICWYAAPIAELASAVFIGIYFKRALKKWIPGNRKEFQ